MIQSAPRYLNSIVFVGNRFPVELFDEHELFDGELEKENQVKLGKEFAQFNYKGGSCRFTVMQNRVDIAYSGSHILPDMLVDSAKNVANKIDSVRDIIQITGVGINCDALFARESINASGIDFCSKLIRPQFTKLVGATHTNNPVAMGKIVFTDKGVRYEVRIEPDLASQEGNLFVATNGHQDIIRQELVAPKLERFNAFKVYVQKFHQRIVTGGVKNGNVSKEST